jgi:hypothetical protein
MDLDTNWTIQFGAGHLTLSWCPNHHFGYSRCYRPKQAFLCSDSWSPWKMGLGASWTIQNRGGQISYCQGFVSISCFPAQLGIVQWWEHQIWNLLKKVHPVMPRSSILGKILYAPKSPPSEPAVEQQLQPPSASDSTKHHNSLPHCINPYIAMSPGYSVRYIIMWPHILVVFEPLSWLFRAFNSS